MFIFVSSKTKHNILRILHYIFQTICLKLMPIPFIDTNFFLTSVRNIVFVSLFLFTGNFQQAGEKDSNTSPKEDYYRLFTTSRVQLNPDYLDYLETELDHLLKRRYFNGTVMVAHNGTQAFNKSYGNANFRQRIPLDKKNNVYQLASVGKQFTAFSVLILYEKGLLELDDKVHTYIEDFPYDNITVRQLLNHTSGLQNYFYLIDNYWIHEHLPTHHDMLQLIKKHSLPLNFTPGRRFSYSNTGYAFLAMIVEKISGESFAEFTQNHIFNPLKMENSFVFDAQTGLPGDEKDYTLARGHQRWGRSFRVIPVDYIDGVSGDKGVFSSAEDLLIWDNALENNILVSQESKEMAFERARLRSGYAVNYGFGFRLRKQNNNDVLYHNGWWKGFRTAYLRLPDNTLLVILNNTNASINGLERQIQTIIARSPFKIIEEESEDLMAISHSMD